MARFQHFTSSEKAQLWERWSEGDSVREIAQLLGRGSTGVFKTLKRLGGMRPEPRHRSVRSLSLEERESISRSLACGKSLRAIAKEIGRSPSTVS